MYPYGNQQQYGFGSAPNYQQQQQPQPGYSNNWSMPQNQQQNQQQPQQQPIQSFNSLQTQPTGYGFGGQNQQPLASQTTGWNQQQLPPMTGFQAQQTGGLPLSSQRTGFQPQQQQPMSSFQSQPTGGQPLMPQRTGFQQEPLTNQTTGWNQPPMTSFQAQPTGGLPLASQRTGFQPQQPMTSFQSQPTGGQPMTSFQSQPTGGQPLMSQRTGFQQQPMTNQITGWNQQPPMTSFQAQPTGKLPLESQRTGFQQPSLTSQTTGWNQPTPATSFGMPLQSQTTGWNIQSQQTGAPQPLISQPTGFISALGSFGSTENTSLTIPNIRLSFITARDQGRFEKIFRTNVPIGENAVDGQTAKQILMKSGLNGTQLADIWALSDTNKSGSLMFPEFALALHLCNMAKRGESIPFELPLKMKNEVTGFVDAINFNIGIKKDVPDNTPFKDDLLNGGRPQQTGYLQQQATGYGNLQPQRTGLVPLTAQQTSGLIPVQQAGIMGQRTGGLMPQQTGFQPQPPTSFQSQPTGVLMLQPTGFPSQQTGGLMPQQTGFQSQPTGGLMSQPTGLQAMPTGRPGQWGFVSMPTGGLPGLDMMQSHFLPNAQSQASNLANYMGGNSASNVTWSITKQEKLIYDNIFKKWDTQRNGFVTGDVAIAVFTKSGLNRTDLEKIWTLADQGNKGKLNKDEFAVAMHLIYRRLNGFDIPSYLPPELIPPSSKVLEDTVGDLKNRLKRDAVESNLKNVGPSSSAGGANVIGSKFKNNDDDIEYVSNSRHRRKGATKNDEIQDAFSTKFSVDDLKKQIHEKKILLDAVDTRDEDESNDYSKQKTSNEIEMLKTKIKSAQSQLNSGPGNTDTVFQEKEQVSKKLNRFSDRVPQLIDAIYSTDNQIKNAKIELYRLKLHRENPTGLDMRGTGPNGEITEADRRIAKQKALLQSKMAKLTGKPAPSFEAFESNEAKLNNEIIKITQESEQERAAIKDIAISIKTLVSDISGSLNLTNSMAVGYAKWEQKQGVQNHEVSDFIDYLNSTKPAAHETLIKDTNPYLSNSSSNFAVSSSNTSNDTNVDSSVNKVTKNPAPPPQKQSTLVSESSGLSAAEERAKRIKEKAEKRMNERLAKLGIKRKSSGGVETISSTSPKQETVTSAPPASTIQPVAIPKPTAPVPPPARVPSVHRQVEKAPEPFEEGSPSSSSSDDDELNRLIAEKKALEQREHERKNRKRLEKENRIAKLKAEMEALKKEEEDDSDDSWDEPAKPSIPTPSSVKATPQQKPSHAAASAHSNNPFASMTNNGTKETVSSSTANPVSTVPNTHVEPASSTNSYNPFAKSTAQPEKSKFDAEKLEAQRSAQRGMTNDDWSDSEHGDSDDEMPTSSKQAELASMLFGGSTAPSRTSTFVPPSKEESLSSIPVEKSQSSETPEAHDGMAPAPPIPTVEAPIISETPSDPEIIASSISSVHETAHSTEDKLPSISLINAPELSAPPIPAAESLLPASMDNSSEFFDAHSEESSFIDPTPPSSPEMNFGAPPPLPEASAPSEPSASSELLPPPIPELSAPPAPIAPPPPPIPELSPPPAAIAATPPPIPQSLAPSTPPALSASISLMASPPPPMPEFSAPPTPMTATPPPPPPPMPESSAPPAPMAPPPPPMPEPSTIPTLNPVAPVGGNTLTALLGEINLGKSLKKVDESEKHVADGAVVGKVLD